VGEGEAGEAAGDRCQDHHGFRTDYGDQIERSGWLEWRSHRCPKVTGTTSMFKYQKPFLTHIKVNMIYHNQ
jgi:hypothetical protein